MLLWFRKEIARTLYENAMSLTHYDFAERDGDRFQEISSDFRVGVEQITDAEYHTRLMLL